MELPERPVRAGASGETPGASARRARTRSLPAALVAGALALSMAPGCSRDVEGLGLVLDPVGELASAEVHREVGEIDLGTPAAAPHRLWGWSWNEREPAGDGSETTYAWGLGASSGLRFYLVTRRDLHLELRARPGPPAPEGPQVVTIDVNGRSVERVTLEPRSKGWRVYPVEVPRETLTAGWNTLSFGYRHAVEPRKAGLSGDRRALAVAWDRVRLEPARSAEEAGPEAVRTGAAAGGERALRLPLGTEVSYSTRLPPGSVLAFEALRATGADARLLVGLQWAGEDPIDLASLRPAERRRVMELPAPAGEGAGGDPRPARLSLRAVPAGWLEAREAATEGAIEVVAPRVLAPAQTAGRSRGR